MASRAASSPAPAAQVADLRESGFLSDRLSLVSARFSNASVENGYQKYLAKEGAQQQMLFQTLGAVVFVIYGILDGLVVGSLFREFLFVRLLIATPLAFGVMSLSWLAPFRRYLGLATALALIVMCSAVIYMIFRMPAADSPPYVIGVLVIMVYTACLMRINFPIAAAAFVLIGALYCLALISKPDETRADLISGIFFMMSVCTISIVTSYMQERRARMVWHRDEQRDRDAEVIRSLLIEATAADRSKINFLSVVTYELRTPLHQIIGYSEVVRRREDNNENAGYLEQVIASAQELLKKLGKMLRYADASAGKINAEIEKCAIRDIVDQAVDQFAADALRKSVSLKAESIEACSVMADPHLTSYALQNIIENAITASKPGGAVVIEGKATGSDHYLVCIRDSGCGMSPEKLASALSPFDQAETGYSRSSSGLGLGLPIAKMLLAEQNASIQLSSDPNSGTTAFVKLPITGAETEKDAA